MDPVSGPIPEQLDRVATSPSFATRTAEEEEADRNIMGDILSTIPSRTTWHRRGFLARIAAVPTVLFAAPALADSVVSGTVSITQTQIAFIGSGNLGGGVLNYGGKSYPFTIGGLGIGGFGISKIEATGKVYDLKNLNDFAGAYVQGRYGAVAGNKSTGELWLTNAVGVSLSLNAKRQGLALSLGGDAIYIDFD
jgi:hypothetical protein